MYSKIILGMDQTMVVNIKITYKKFNATCSRFRTFKKLDLRDIYTLTSTSVLVILYGNYVPRLIMYTSTSLHVPNLYDFVIPTMH